MGPSPGAGRGTESVSSRRKAQHRQTSLAIAQMEQPPGLKDLPVNDNTVRSSFNRLSMKGDLPWFNDWANILVDHDGHKLYLYGGCRPNNDASTSDFHCCDLDTMRWTDLTNSVQFCPEPGDPFANGPYKRPLPALRKPSTTFLRLNERNFILIFGGRKNKTLSSDLYAVDVNNLTWWAVRIEGGPVASRMCASIVAIETRLYIFGGLAADAVSSFCIAEYSADDRRWKWIICDQPYPQHTPNLGSAAEAIPVYNGKKIMLMRGRTADTERIDLSCETTVLFHTSHHTFQAQTGTVGDFPQRATWYQLQTFSSPPKRPASKSSLPPSRSRAIRNPPDHFQSGSSAVRVAEPDTGSQPATSSALMCAWIDHADGFLVPELWQYLLPPDERLRCLNVRENLWNLDLDLQMFIVSGSRLFFMGRGEEEDPIWNICVEMFLEGLA